MYSPLKDRIALQTPENCSFLQSPMSSRSLVNPLSCESDRSISLRVLDDSFANSSAFAALSVDSFNWAAVPRIVEMTIPARAAYPHRVIFFVRSFLKRSEERRVGKECR